MKTLPVVLVFLCLAAGALLPQQDVVLTIREGVPAISLALPNFLVPNELAKAQTAAAELHDVLSADLGFSRVFQLLPKSYYSYIKPLSPGPVAFKDWSSIQAALLLTGEASEAAGGNIVLEGKLYDVRSERLILGKRFQAEPGLLRLMAHRLADEMLKVYGEKPVFTSKIVFVSNRDGNDELYMMDYDGAGQTRLTFNAVRDYMPSWSADGRRIAYTSYKKESAGLYILDLDQGKYSAVSTRGVNFSPAFSPDGRKLAFCSTMDGNSEIYVADSDGRNIKRLTFGAGIDTAPSWSPTSREIAFTSDRGGTPQIYIMDAEGTNVRRVSFGGNYFDSPAWSPTGDRIVCACRVDNVFDLYVLNLRTRQFTKLTESNARNESPSWSPDGRHIVFASNLRGGSQIFCIDYDGTNLRALTSRGANKLPDWSN
ncbi:MAG: Tol-Pal system beta propeller repeat protein TolB [Candidatus Aminicenantes bacterium RBG_13_62_12]|nr:MAG: Tol-Pal system beta propeller repeat protein TolB [Candidatus Aminicenantes bacterium RBG_13_62_12]